MTITIDSPRVKFREVLTGFEQYSFTSRQLAEYQFDLEHCASDLAACKSCDGNLCRTIQNKNCCDPEWHIQPNRRCGDDCYPQKNRAYYALYHHGCRMYGGPSFAVHMCPGVIERKNRLRNKMQSRLFDV